jgi:hypothetical protein
MTIEQTYQRMVDEGLIDTFASDSSVMHQDQMLL